MHAPCTKKGMAGVNMAETFEPKIVGFVCNWCSYAGADLAGTSRIQYPPNVVFIRMMCSGRVDPQFVLKALKDGADGVLIGGCHYGDCHYQSGNYKTARKVTLTKKLLEDMGLEPERLRFEHISASEGNKLANVVREFTEEIRKLGPNPIKGGRLDE